MNFSSSDRNITQLLFAGPSCTVVRHLAIRRTADSSVASEPEIVSYCWQSKWRLLLGRSLTVTIVLKRKWMKLNVIFIFYANSRGSVRV